MGQRYSGKWGTDFAGIIKGLEQTSKIGAITGSVVGLSPLTISIMSGDVILNSKVQNIFVTETLSRKSLVQGDIVVIIPSESEKVFYVIDKVTRE